MSMGSEFKEFIARGNVIDLAVGVIIGGAFGKIVTSLVEQVIMPPIGLAMGGVDFASLKWVLKPDDPATKAVEEVAIQYGAFVNTVIQFLIVALVIFLVVKAINSMRREEAEAPGRAAGADHHGGLADGDPGLTEEVERPCHRLAAGAPPLHPGPPMTKAKICGLTTPAAVKAAVDGGAAYLGFAFFQKSPRNIELFRRPSCWPGRPAGRLTSSP